MFRICQSVRKYFKEQVEQDWQLLSSAKHTFQQQNVHGDPDNDEEQGHGTEDHQGGDHQTQKHGETEHDTQFGMVLKGMVGPESPLGIAGKSPTGKMIKWMIYIHLTQISILIKGLPILSNHFYFSIVAEFARQNYGPELARVFRVAQKNRKVEYGFGVVGKLFWLLCWPNWPHGAPSHWRISSEK